MRKIAVETYCKKTLADIFTPVGIYLRLRDRFRDTILLESADFNSAENSWSFIGVQAIAGFEIIDMQTAEFKFPGLPPERRTIAKSSEVVGLLKEYLDHFELSAKCTVKA